MLISSLKIDKQSFLSFWTDGSVMGWASTAQCHNSVHSEQFTLHITLHSTQMAQLRVGPAQHSGTTLYTLHITHYKDGSVMGCTTDYTTVYTLDTGKWTLFSYGLGQLVSEGPAHLCTLHSAHLCTVSTVNLCTLPIYAQCNPLLYT